MAPTIQQLFDLTGKTALLTGGCGHLGSAMAAALAEAGASVIITSRDVAKAQAGAAKLPKHGDARHHGIALNHIAPDSLDQSFAEALKLGGKLDILINNGTEGPPGDWSTVTAADFNRHLANATGYFLLARMFRNHVIERKAPGSVVMLGSMYGSVGSYPDAYEGVCPASPVAYHALKGGIAQLTRHLAAYWARDGVRVNCLSPGPFPRADAPQEMVKRLCTKLPMGRMGQPHELKGAIVFLASAASSFMTGQNLLIDGGWTAW